jgi:putative methyltransferase (TIGR04325 family)
MSRNFKYICGRHALVANHYYFLHECNLLQGIAPVIRWIPSALRLVGKMILKVKIFIRGLLAPIIGFSLAKDWETAKRRTSGYEGKATLKSLTSRIETLKTPTDLPQDDRLSEIVKAIRDSELQINSTRPIRVLDIGGSFGEHFFHLQNLIPEYNFEWTVLETEGHCSIIPEFLTSTQGLWFISKPPTGDQFFDIALLSSVIQYVDDPYELLTMALRISDSVIVNRLPLSTCSKDRVAIQRPGLMGSKGSYPVHIFSEAVFTKYLEPTAEIRSRWMVPQDSAVIRFKYIENQGLLLKPRRNTSV